MNKLMLIMAVCILCICSISVHGAVIHYEQNFDNLKDGEAEQDGWAMGPPATDEMPTTITSEVFHGDSGKSMKVDPEQVVIRDFDPIIKSGVHFLSLWFRYELQNVTDDKLFIYMGEEIKEWAGGPVCYIGGNSADPNKVTVYNDANATPVGENILVGEWQHFFEVINVDNQTYSVYVDDVLVAEDFLWRNPGNHKGLGWLMFGFDRGKGGTVGYYDDVVFGEGEELIQAVAPGDKLAATWGHLKSGQ